uniref:Uncharacterized protein n=1 Tax=Mycena chlorophos TaxID=658473 RepID=A0ABQ0LXD9_MYCCL|nr:predicted protein [Mycena chlorophos]
MNGAVARPPAPAASAAAPRRYKPKPRKTRAEKNAAEEEHFRVVLNAAHTTIAILSRQGFATAIFGGLASKLYGNSRCPKDVDIIVYPTRPEIDAEAVKRLIVATEHRYFYLKAARNPEATYKILWFRDPNGRRESKVDILVPASATDMSLPHYIPPERVVFVQAFPRLPLAPFPFVLMHKLKGWADHRVAEETFKRVKQQTDAADVRRLLETSHARLLRTVPNWWLDPVLFDRTLREAAVQRVREYCKAFPHRTKDWTMLGIDTSEPESEPEVVLYSGYLAFADDQNSMDMRGLSLVDDRDFDDDDGVFEEDD